MTTDPVYIFLLVVIVFLLYMILREREATVVQEPTIIERVVGPTNYLPNRFYGGYPGDVWFHGPALAQGYGPHYRHFWGPHINPGRRYF